MESSPVQHNPDDPSSVLAAADQARDRLTAGLHLPAGLYPVLAAAMAVQIGTAGYGVAAQTTAGLVVAVAGLVAFGGVAALALYRFRQVNGVRVDGLTSQVLLGEGTASALVYAAAFGAATWSAFESRWWLVAAAALAGGAGYALLAQRWWHAYRDDPAGHAGGISPRVLAVLAVLGMLALVALVVLG